MTVSYTSHLRLPIPDFLQEPWHSDLENSIRAIDTALYQAILAQSVTNWANSTAYAVGALVIDALTGLLWTCGVAHTSSTTPTTFATDRTNHPTYWNGIANVPQQRGTWLTATSYTVGDFVIDSNRYAVCIVSHTSGVFNTDLAAAKWSLLIDLSTLAPGVNLEAEGTVASASTADIGASTPSRIFITGTTTITSFGTVANKIKILRYQGALTITYNAVSLILFGSVDRVTAAGDIQIVSSDSTGKWRELSFNRGDGAPISLSQASTTVQGKVELATAAETQALTDPDRAVTPLGLASALADLSATILTTIRNGVGASLDTLSEIATAMGLLAPAANPTFTGTVAITGSLTTTTSVGVGTSLTVGSGFTVTAGAVAVPAGSIANAALAIPAQRVLLETLTASASASLVNAVAWDSTYAAYEIMFDHILPATATNTGLIQVHSGGAYKTSGYLSVVSTDDSGGTTGAATTGTTNIPITRSAVVGNAGVGISGTITVVNPSSVNVHPFLGRVGFEGASAFYGSTVSGAWNTGAAIDGFKFLFASGNIASGSIRVYGIK